MEYENNILYIDLEKMDHHMILANNKSPRIRMYLGKLEEDHFERTTETILELPQEQQTEIRS